LKDGRVLFAGGNGQPGAIYDLGTGLWSPGEAIVDPYVFCVLPDGEVLCGDSFYNPVTNTFRPSNAIASWQQATILPDGTAFATNSVIHSMKYVPSMDQWVDAGGSFGDGFDTNLLMYNGKVMCMGAGGAPSIYTPGPSQTAPGSWAVGPSLPNDSVLGTPLYDSGGEPCMLPNGNVLYDASLYNLNITNRTGIRLVEYNGTNWTEDALDPFNADQDLPRNVSMLVLPTGQVLISDQTNNLYVYTPAGGPQDAWRPKIALSPAHVTPALDSVVQGTQFNGLSQGSSRVFYPNATNFPLIKLTNQATGHVLFCRSHDYSTMGVATGSQTVSTSFSVPWNAEPGPSTLQVVANGISSLSIPVTVDVRILRDLLASPSTVPAGTNVTGTIRLVNPAPSGGITVNLSSNSPAAVVPETATVPAGQTQANFTIHTVNSTYTPLQSTISATSSGETANPVHLVIDPGNYAQFLSQDTPASIYVDQSTPVTLQFKNTGTTTWDSTHGYILQGLDPSTYSSFFGFTQMAISNPPVAPGGARAWKR